MRLLFDPKPSGGYPHGYWYAGTDDGNYNAVGATVEAALAALVIALEEAVQS